MSTPQAVGARATETTHEARSPLRATGGWPAWLTPAGLALGVAMVALLGVLTRRVGDPDFWWHLRTAQWIVDNHALPSHDLFTYTATAHAWVDQEYGSELLIIGLYRAGGFAAVSLGFAAITWAGFWLILRRIRLEPVPVLVAAAALGLGALAGVAVWGPRAQMITFSLTCLELSWLEAFLRGRSRSIYALPAVVVVWANFHAGFVFSLFFLVLAVAVEAVLWWLDRAAIEHRKRAGRLLLILLLCGVGGLLTPHGIDLYRYVVKTQFSSVQQSFIAEWHAPDFHRLDTRGLELLILLLAVGLALRRPRLWDVAVGVAATVLALQAVRHTAVFVAAATPIIAWSYAGAWQSLGFRERAARWLDGRRGLAMSCTAALLAVAVIATGLVMRSTLRGQAVSSRTNFPVAAADWLEQHPQTGNHMFNAYDWGGYLLNRFYPQENRRVFSFGEAVVMGDPLMQQISDIENAKPDWQSILTEHQVDYVVERPDSPLTMALSVDPGWQKAYDDGFAVILVRR